MVSGTKLDFKKDNKNIDSTTQRKATFSFLPIVFLWFLITHLHRNFQKLSEITSCFTRFLFYLSHKVCNN